MRSTRFLPVRLALVALLALALAAVGCGKQGGETPPPAAAPTPSSAPALPPGHPPTDGGQMMAGPPPSALPEGHPPLDATGGAAAGMGAPQLAPPAPGTGIGSSGLSWTSPSGWESQVPSSAMRRAQYRVPGPGGDGECVVFYFGPGEGGDPKSNALRWASQFQPAGGLSPEQALKTGEMRVGAIPVMTVEVAGTYMGGGAMMGGPSEPRPDYMLLGAVAEGPDANWFFKFTGPAKTIESNRAAFGDLLKS
ncbi:MAG: hypothetical protein MUE47_06170, partial [Acidobacteria bacterium]|nr:hypothetical protein [Acidobacteriota bacterium]